MQPAGATQNAGKSPTRRCAGATWSFCLRIIHAVMVSARYPPRNVAMTKAIIAGICIRPTPTAEKRYGGAMRKLGKAKLGRCQPCFAVLRCRDSGDSSHEDDLRSKCGSIDINSKEHVQTSKHDQWPPCCPQERSRMIDCCERTPDFLPRLLHSFHMVRILVDIFCLQGSRFVALVEIHSVFVRHHHCRRSICRALVVRFGIEEEQS
jgi:hypothetical protein